MASQQIPSKSIAGYASADLSAKQYYAGLLSEVSGVKSVALAGAGTGTGIIINTPANGELCDLVVSGGAKAKLGGTVSANQKLKSDGSGKLIAVTSNNDLFLATALQDGVSNDIIEVIVERGYYGV